MSGRRSSHLLMTAFFVIGALFGSVSLASMIRAVGTRREIRTMVSSSFERMELLSRMNRDVDRERLLIDAHTFETSTVNMRAVEHDIESVKSDFDMASNRYERTVQRDGDSTFAWGLIRNGIREIQPTIATALELSRANRDVEARTAMVHLDSLFAVIDGAFAELTRLSRLETEATRVRIAAIQRTSAWFADARILVGLLGTLVMGIWATRAVAERELQSTKYVEALDARNRELDAFAGRVAHDLRGPLTSINLVSSKLPQETPQDARAAAVLRRGIARMEAMIDDLLTLSRVAGVVRGGICDPARVVEQIREEIAPRLDSAGVSMSIDVASEQAQCSESLLRQVLWNLTDNGVKYRRRDAPATIRVEGRPTGRMYAITLSDNGLGMSDDDARHAFEPFFRSPHVADLPGTGLGLSIARRVIEASGGTIVLESALGLGTTFHLRVPLAKQPADAGVT